METLKRLPSHPATHATRMVVEESEAGTRLDGFLARRQTVPSAAAARRAIASGIVQVNGRAAKKGVHLQAGDAVELGENSTAGGVLEADADQELSVLYQDDDLVAVDKAAGVASHPLRPGDGPTVASALVARFPECTVASPDPREGGLGHRLDVGTSGVLLAARSREAWHRLREALATAGCEKIYLAEVRGDFPSALEREFVLPGPRPASFVVTAPIGRHGRRGSKVRLAAGRQPLPARTEITLLETRPSGALVEARLAQGRAHQVRAHLAHLGIPVVGDATYGEAEAAAEIGLRLHAWAVSFVHPITLKSLHIEAPLPAWARRQKR
jgi:23S rRNA pseudouridine1911/1915/1917 synthase